MLPEERSSLSLKLVAGALALVATALVLAGYAYLRSRNAQQNLADTRKVQQAPPNVSKGPPKAHVFVDEALLKGGQTIIGGTVRNVSAETLDGLKVGLELRRRKDGKSEQTTVSINPSRLEPDAEGRYSLTVPAQDYGSVRLLGLNVGLDSAPLAYTSSQGQKRPPERLQPKIVTIPRPPSARGEFLNSPDNPARVP
jgi:hypothetical protein